MIFGRFGTLRSHLRIETLSWWKIEFRHRVLCKMTFMDKISKSNKNCLWHWAIASQIYWFSWNWGLICLVKRNVSKNVDFSVFISEYNKKKNDWQQKKNWKKQDFRDTNWSSKSIFLSFKCLKDILKAMLTFLHWRNIYIDIYINLHWRNIYNAKGQLHVFSWNWRSKFSLTLEILFSLTLFQNYFARQL